MRKEPNYKKAALRLARAIIRFQNNNWQYNHTESTIAFAYKIRKNITESA